MYKTFSQIKSIFNNLKKKSKFDLSKTKLHLGSLKEFPNERDFAYTTIEKYPQIYISPKLKFQSLEIIKAILTHEISHAILISKKKKHSELQTDNFAKKLFNKHIYYNKNDVQTLKKTKKVKRPRYLKNPKELNDKVIDLFAGAYYYGDAADYCWAMIYYKQGEKCNDCDENFRECSCERCNDCQMPICIENLNLRDNYWNDQAKEKVRNRILEIINTFPKIWQLKFKKRVKIREEQEK